LAGLHFVVFACLFLQQAIGILTTGSYHALALFFASRRRAAQRSKEQRKRSREEFGSEYERTVEERGSEEETARELRERRGRVEWQIERLSSESRGRFDEQWTEVERVFVDNPERSIEMADRTVFDVLTERKFVSD
jgi:hypothetical protein